MFATMWYFFWIVAFVVHGIALDVKIEARSAILMNAETGVILYEKDAYALRYPASVTKIATALFVLDEKNPPLDQKVTVDDECLKMKNDKNWSNAPSFWLESDGTMMHILKGEVLSINDLMHGLMLISGNDAANVLAHSFTKNIPDFLDEMNAYLKRIGCQNTQYRNPHGLHDVEHFTTAYDIALMMKKALTIPKFRTLVSTVSYTKPKTNKQGKKEIETFNPLIKPNNRRYYPKAIGGKTGFHTPAGSNLAIAAEHEGRTLIAIVLGSGKTARYSDAVALFEAAFAEKLENQRIFGPETALSYQIQGVEDPLKAVIQKEIALSYYPSENPHCKAFVHWEVPALPIKKGQKVGEVRVVSQDGALLKKEDLTAQKELKGSFWYHLKKRFL